MKKKEISPRDQMLKFINQHNSKYDNIFIKIINYYDVRDMSEVSDEALQECCNNLRRLDEEEKQQQDGGECESFFIDG